jgi:hypothetical protein
MLEWWSSKPMPVGGTASRRCLEGHDPLHAGVVRLAAAMGLV